MNNIQIKNWRLDHGLTQAQASKISCVSLRSWQRYESGHRNPSKATLKLLKLYEENFEQNKG